MSISQRSKLACLAKIGSTPPINSRVPSVGLGADEPICLWELEFFAPYPDRQQMCFKGSPYNMPFIFVISKYLLSQSFPQ